MPEGNGKGNGGGFAYRGAGLGPSPSRMRSKGSGVWIPFFQVHTYRKSGAPLALRWLRGNPDGLDVGDTIWGLAEGCGIQHEFVEAISRFEDRADPAAVLREYGSVGTDRRRRHHGDRGIGGLVTTAATAAPCRARTRPSSR